MGTSYDAAYILRTQHDYFSARKYIPAGEVIIIDAFSPTRVLDLVLHDVVDWERDVNLQVEDEMMRKTPSYRRVFPPTVDADGGHACYVLWHGKSSAMV